MSFAFTVKIKYTDPYLLSWEQLAEFLLNDGYSPPSELASLCYDAYGDLEIVFQEHDNEEFMANLIAEKLLCLETDDSLEEVRISSIDWDGLDKHLDDYWKSRVTKKMGHACS